MRMKLYFLNVVILQLLTEECLSMEKLPEEISRKLSTLGESVRKFLQEMQGSLDEATQKLKDAEMKTKQHLSENLLKTLQYLKGQITSYLSELIATITQKISSLLENQEEAKAVAAIFVLKELKQIDDYLQRELPKLKGALMELNKKIQAAKGGEQEGLRVQLVNILNQAKARIQQELENIKAGVQDKLAEAKDELGKRSMEPPVTPESMPSNTVKPEGDSESGGAGFTKLSTATTFSASLYVTLKVLLRCSAPQ